MLQLIDLSIGFSRKKAILSGVNLVAERGKFTTLLGLNGSGKSTLLKTCLGLLPALSGQILIEGKSIQSFSLAERARKISLLESQNQLSFSITVRELLETAIRLHDDKKIFDEALEAVDLLGYEDRNALELSSGELKRAFLAHTLCSKSEIILLDEPLAHLDWRHQTHLVQSLKAWSAKYNTTFVLAIHELEWIVKIADRACAVGNGRILAQGPPKKVFLSPEVCEVFAFKAAIDENPIDGSQRLTLGENA